ncbi:hypothetical protein F4819DRAFT_452166 [Hypoxylon fuscum]|nr:hypothetical protein F4819DRAFT_452166 [Hypoxylon fuscum]
MDTLHSDTSNTSPNIRSNAALGETQSANSFRTDLVDVRCRKRKKGEDDGDRSETPCQLPTELSSNRDQEPSHNGVEGLGASHFVSPKIPVSPPSSLDHPPPKDDKPCETSEGSLDAGGTHQCEERNEHCSSSPWKGGDSARLPMISVYGGHDQEEASKLPLIRLIRPEIDNSHDKPRYMAEIWSYLSGERTSMQPLLFYGMPLCGTLTWPYGSRLSLRL